MRWLWALFLIIIFYSPSYGQKKSIEGLVININTKQPIEGVSLRLLNAKTLSISNQYGFFSFNIEQADTLIVSMVGFAEERLFLPLSDTNLKIQLKEINKKLDEVIVQTGYYQLPKERATGSFVHLNNEKLNRIGGTNILNRIDGMLEGVQFIAPNGTSPSDIRVRGLSTIESDETPLIILDNFPFEGTIDMIDPNTIESITVLKDAAAASIWGARAGNGVIVITSKAAKRNHRTNISFLMESNLTERPDFMYSRNRMLSETVMKIEKEKFDAGLYTFNDGQAQSVYVDYLRRHKLGIISTAELQQLEETLQNSDIRKQAMEYLYQKSSYQKASLIVSGGNEKHGYLINASRTWTQEKLIGNNAFRNNLNITNSFNPLNSLRINLGLVYHTNFSVQRGIGIEQLNFGGGQDLAPYLRLVDNNGNALDIPRNGLDPFYVYQAEDFGLLDWKYKPLEDREMRFTRSNEQDLRLNTDLSYKISNYLTIKGVYQYKVGQNESTTHYQKDSYYVRDLVNAFTQVDGSRLIPHNGILNSRGSIKSLGHYGRLQFDLNKEFGLSQNIYFLGGAEWRHHQNYQSPGYILYDYDENYRIGINEINFKDTYRTRPRNVSRRIPNANTNNRILTNRDISYYSNIGYDLFSRYIFSGSVRWDGSNLFGIKTNKKGVPLWSLGFAWNLIKEPKFGFNSIFDELKLRSTYGISGNVNKTVSHMPSIRFGTESLTGLRNATILNVGNSSLRWEKVNMLNFGLDWSLKNRKYSGAIEYYEKHGNDLIGNEYMDPTVGITGDYKINYANIKSKGWDFKINSLNNIYGVTWQYEILSSWVKNKITNYNVNQNISLSYYFSSPPPVVGVSKDAVYAFPWNGLSNVTGLPIIYINGVQTMDYREYYLTFDPKELKIKGSFIPTWYGSVLNTFIYKDWNLSFMINWKSGYVFRRSSMEPFQEYENKYHMDYYQRWQNPGDEKFTVVPKGLPFTEQNNYNGVGTVFKFSEALVEDGSHLRLQDFKIGYSLKEKLSSKVGVRNLAFNIWVRDLGLIWAKNNLGIDPNFVDQEYVTPRSLSLGVQIGL